MEMPPHIGLVGRDGFSFQISTQVLEAIDETLKIRERSWAELLRQVMLGFIAVGGRQRTQSQLDVFEPKPQILEEAVQLRDEEPILAANQEMFLPVSEKAVKLCLQTLGDQARIE